MPNLLFTLSQYKLELLCVICPLEVVKRIEPLVKPVRARLVEVTLVNVPEPEWLLENILVEVTLPPLAFPKLKSVPTFKLVEVPLVKVIAPKFVRPET